MKKLSHILVMLLMLDAAWVARGLYLERNMWRWIVVYWLILTLKNLCDWIAGREEK